LVGLGQGTQVKAKPVGARTGAELRAKVRPCLAQSVFVQSWQVCPGSHAIFSSDPFFKQICRHGCQASLGSRITPATAIKVNLYVQHRNGWAFNPMQDRTIWQLELLNRQRSPRISAKKGASPEK
jgi:hypothetical protein